MPELNVRDFAGIAWDFDGVWTNSPPIHTECREEAYKREAVTKNDPRYVEIPEEVHAQAHLHGSHPEQINAWIMAEGGIIDDPEDVKHPAVVDLCVVKNELYLARATDGLPPIPGVLQVVRSFNAHRPGKQAVASTASRAEVMPFIQNNGLSNYFPDKRLVLKGHPEVTRPKPAPDAYAAAGRALGITVPSDLLVFEDSEQGIEAAIMYGATVFAIATTRDQERLEGLVGVERPDRIFPDFYAVSDAFGVPNAA